MAATLEVRSFRNEDNSLSVVVIVPPRRNGEVNFGALARLNRELLTIAPDAFDPPYEEAAVAHHAAEAPMPPALEELIARAEVDDEGPDALKAGEAYREHG